MNGDGLTEAERTIIRQIGGLLWAKSVERTLPQGQEFFKNYMNGRSHRELMVFKELESNLIRPGYEEVFNRLFG